MKKIKSVNNIYNEEGQTFIDTLENLIFSYLDEDNAYRL